MFLYSPVMSWEFPVVIERITRARLWLAVCCSGRYPASPQRLALSGWSLPEGAEPGHCGGSGGDEVHQHLHTFHPHLPAHVPAGEPGPPALLWDLSAGKMKRITWPNIRWCVGKWSCSCSWTCVTKVRMSSVMQPSKSKSLRASGCIYSNLPLFCFLKGSLYILF